jgi:ParB/RepB/Spo0J family partition protein
MTEAVFRTIPITQITPHPDNPRLRLRQDVVEILAASLRERGFAQEHAILVRPFGDGYQVISGHHRLAAAQQAGLAELPCWVREMSDDEAFLGLILNNTQGELSGLEVGMAALRYREKGTGGRGNVGGLGAYARAIGRDPSYVGRLAAAAQVYEAVGQAFPQVEQWDGLMRHLAEIARAPTHFWPMLTGCHSPGHIPWYDGFASSPRMWWEWFALEVDRGTEPLKVLLGKGTVYRDMTVSNTYRRHFGGDLLPVFLAPTTRRAGQIAREWNAAWVDKRGNSLPSAKGVIATINRSEHPDYGPLWGEYSLLRDGRKKVHLLKNWDLVQWNQLCKEAG